MFKRYIKDGKSINATEKAYQVIFKGLGYKAYNGNEHDPRTGSGDIEDMTKAEITEALTAKGIDFNPRDKKDKLLELLMAGD